MSDMVVFTSPYEVIIVAVEHVNKVITDWFLNGGRSLDNFDVYLEDGKEGFAILNQLHLNGSQEDFDVIDLLPKSLIKQLVDANRLTE